MVTGDARGPGRRLLNCPVAHLAFKNSPQNRGTPPDPEKPGRKGGWEGRHPRESGTNLLTTDPMKTWSDLCRTQEPRGGASLRAAVCPGANQDRKRAHQGTAWALEPNRLDSGARPATLMLWDLGKLPSTFVLWSPISKTGSHPGIGLWGCRGRLAERLTHRKHSVLLPLCPLSRLQFTLRPQFVQL